MNEIEKLQELQPEMVETLKKVIGYNTEKSQALPDAPFGDGNRNCLDYVLQTAKGMGLSTYNCDGYCGQVDFVGSGKQVVGILGHLDVVPAKKSDGWVCDPYAPEIIDGKLIHVSLYRGKALCINTDNIAVKPAKIILMYLVLFQEI
ncbi:MAG: hypothetical protein RR291_01245, partial [Clostridia bacterium]